jgi:hypothetical protein
MTSDPGASLRRREHVALVVATARSRRIRRRSRARLQGSGSGRITPVPRGGHGYSSPVLPIGVPIRRRRAPAPDAAADPATSPRRRLGPRGHGAGGAERGHRRTSSAARPPPIGPAFRDCCLRGSSHRRRSRMGRLCKPHRPCFPLELSGERGPPRRDDVRAGAEVEAGDRESAPSPATTRRCPPASARTTRPDLDAADAGDPKLGSLPTAARHPVRREAAPRLYRCRRQPARPYQGRGKVDI